MAEFNLKILCPPAAKIFKNGQLIPNQTPTGGPRANPEPSTRLDARDVAETTWVLHINGRFVRAIHVQGFVPGLVRRATANLETKRCHNGRSILVVYQPIPMGFQTPFRTVPRCFLHTKTWQVQNLSSNHRHPENSGMHSSGIRD